MRPAWPGVPERLPTERLVGLAAAGDLEERLFERRIVLIGGPLDQLTASAAAARLMLLDADRRSEGHPDGDTVELHLSCPDADLDAAAMLAETIELMGVPVQALARGVVGGPAVAVYAAAGLRRAHPHALFRLTEPRVEADGNADEIAARVAQHEQQLARVHALIAAATGRDVATVAADLRAGLALPAEEAVAYGLVHELVRPRPR